MVYMYLKTDVAGKQLDELKKHLQDHCSQRYNKIIDENYIVIERPCDEKRPKYYVLRGLMKKHDTLIVETITAFGSDRESIMAELDYLSRSRIHVLIIDAVDILIRASIPKKMGRPPVVYFPDDFIDCMVKWREGRLHANDASKLCSMSVATFYRNVRRYKELRENHQSSGDLDAAEKPNLPHFENSANEITCADTSEPKKRGKTRKQKRRRQAG